MEVKSIKQEKGKVVINVDLKDKEWTVFVDKEIKNASKNVKVDGFRKGKVPPEQLKKKLNMQEVYFNAANKAINETIINVDKDKKVEELNVGVYPTPAVDLIDVNDKHLEYAVSYFISPKITIDNYKNLNIDLEVPTVSEKEIDHEIEGILKREKMIKPLKDGSELKKGNQALFDFTGFVDGKEFPGGKAKDFKLEIGSNKFIPGFEDGMIGMKVGEERDLNLTFPKDYHVKDLANKPVVFKVKVKEISEVITPKVDDEFAKNLKFKGVNNLKDLRGYISNAILSFKLQQSNQRNIVLVNQAIYKNAKYDEIPSVMIDDEMKRINEQFQNQLKQMNMKEDMYLNMIRKTKQDILKEMQEQAKSNVVVYGALDYIAQKEKIKVDESKIDDRYKLLSQTYKQSVDEIKKVLDHDAIKDVLMYEQALLDVINWNSKPAKKAKDNKDKQEGSKEKGNDKKANNKKTTTKKTSK